MAARILLATATLLAQIRPHGTQPRSRPEDYSVHVRAGVAVVAAEYLVRSFQGRGGTFVAPDHLVVEVAVFPDPYQRVKLNAGQFSLRVNGARQPLLPEPPSLVGASLRYADWEHRPTVVAGAGVGSGSVILGRPPASERFPGDPRPGRERLPQPPRAPDAKAPVEREPAPQPDEVAVESALPEGEHAGPVSGYLYFLFKKKPKSVRSLELLWHGEGGPVSLRLL
ncbi:MAG: hypothetical protein RMK57_13115 [Bryobacterales bacterium]|nr:hypothetical protein [Bryobacteraceae bacterium]MDW8355457.1 hypothetical protein [Bryobacterales bacterium]